jgi:hypothetical protein
MKRSDLLAGQLHLGNQHCIPALSNDATAWVTG